MAKMNQPGTDKGERGETGEKYPGGDKASDGRGERKERIKNGVGLGMADKTGTQEGAMGRDGLGKGDRGEFNTGRNESECYSHKRLPHDQD